MSEDEPSFGEPNVKFKSLQFQSYLSQQQQQFSHSDEDIFGNKIASKSASSYFYDYVSGNHDQPIDFLAIYDAKNHAKQLFESCSRHKSCHSCHLDTACVWNMQQCESFSLPISSSLNSTHDSNAGNESALFKKPTCSQMCEEFTSCSNCTLSNTRYRSDCVWCASQLKCMLGSSLHIVDPFGECLNTVSKRSECERSYSSGVNLNSAHSIASTSSSSSKLKAVHSNFYYQSFCELNHSNCSSCISDERCGWCSADVNDFFDVSVINNASQSIRLNYSSNTGFGSCMEVRKFNDTILRAVSFL